MLRLDAQVLLHHWRVGCFGPSFYVLILLHIPVESLSCLGSVVVFPPLGGSAAVSCTQRHAAFWFRLRAATSETRNRLGQRSSPRHQEGGLAFVARKRLLLRWRYLNSTDAAPGIGVAVHSNGRRSTCRYGAALGEQRRAESRAASGSHRQAARVLPRKRQPSASCRFDGGLPSSTIPRALFSCRHSLVVPVAATCVLGAGDKRHWLGLRILANQLLLARCSRRITGGS